MHFSSAVAVAALVAGVSAWKNETYVTDVVTSYTTYCPEATTIVQGSKTWTVTEATTLTITDCPCTITKPVYTSTTSSISCEETTTSVYVAPVYTTTAAPYVNATTSCIETSYTATGTGVWTSSPAVFTGAANKAFTASGAGLAGLLGLAAYIL